MLNNNTVKFTCTNIFRKSNQSQKYSFNDSSTNYNNTSSGYQNDVSSPNIKDEKEAFFARKQYENMARPELVN